MTKNENSLNIYCEPIDAHWQFSNFITGEKDSYIIEHLKNLTLRSPLPLNRQVLIIGKLGVGKTHHAKAFYNYIADEKADNNPHYTTSNNFLLNFMNSIRDNNYNAFIKEFMNYSSLILEDIHTIANKEKTQESLSIILDDFIAKNKPIIITSSKSIRKLKGFDKKLKTHILGGTTLKLHKADYNTLLKYLNLKVKEMDLNISSDLLGIIANLPESNNIRLLNGILESLKFCQNKAQMSIDYYQLKNILNLYTQVN